MSSNEVADWQIAARCAPPGSLVLLEEAEELAGRVGGERGRESLVGGRGNVGGDGDPIGGG